MIISVPTMSMNAVIIRTMSLPMSLWLRVATRRGEAVYESGIERSATKITRLPSGAPEISSGDQLRSHPTDAFPG